MVYENPTTLPPGYYWWKSEDGSEDVVSVEHYGEWIWVVQPGLEDSSELKDCQGIFVPVSDMMMSMGWRPIDTAPRDGTVIYLFAKQPHGHNGQHVGRYDPQGGMGNGWNHFWCEASYQNLGAPISGHVTHWMPKFEDPT